MLFFFVCIHFSFIHAQFSVHAYGGDAAGNFCAVITNMRHRARECSHAFNRVRACVRACCRDVATMRQVLNGIAVCVCVGVRASVH